MTPGQANTPSLSTTRGVKELTPHGRTRATRGPTRSLVRHSTATPQSSPKTLVGTFAPDTAGAVSGVGGSGRCPGRTRPSGPAGGWPRCSRVQSPGPSHTHSRSFVRSVRISNSRFPLSNQQTERTKFLESVEAAGSGSTATSRTFPPPHRPCPARGKGEEIPEATSSCGSSNGIEPSEVSEAPAAHRPGRPSRAGRGTEGSGRRAARRARRSCACRCARWCRG